MDHGPAPYVNRRKEIVLETKILKSYEGNYKGPNAGLCEVKHNNGSLLLFTGGKSFALYPETENLFFSKDRNLTFEFRADKMIVRENGQVVEEAARLN